MTFLWGQGVECLTGCEHPASGATLEVGEVVVAGEKGGQGQTGEEQGTSGM